MNRPYSGLASIYDDVMADAVAPVIWRAFVRSRRRYGFSLRSVADVGCGTGWFLERLTNQPRRLYGIDRSRAMLDMAHRRLGRTGVRLLQQDMRKLSLPERVGLISLNFCTLNYLLSDVDLGRVLRACRSNHARGGYLVADALLNVGPVSRPHEVVQDIALPHARSRWRVTFDPSGRGSVVRMWTVLRDICGRLRRWSETHVQRWHRLSRLARMLSQSGYLLLGMHRIDDHRPPTPADRWVQLVAKAV